MGHSYWNLLRLTTAFATFSGTALAASSGGSAPWLRYEPPPECPGESAVAARVAQWLNNAPVPADLAVKAEIAWVDDAWDVHVRVEQTGNAGEREVRVPSCADGADFVALTVVLAIDPSLVEGQHRDARAEPEPVSEEAVEYPTETAGPFIKPDGSTAEDDPSRAAEPALPIERTERPHSPPPALFAGGNGLIQTGNLPGVHAGLGGGLGLAGKHLQASVLGSWIPGRSQGFEMAPYPLRFSQWGVVVRGCYLFRPHGIAFGPCAEVEFARVRVVELDPAGDEAVGKSFFMGGIGAKAEGSLNDRLVPYASVRAALPLDRTAFRVENGPTLHEFAYSVQAEVGLQFFFDRE